MVDEINLNDAKKLDENGKLNTPSGHDGAFPIHMAKNLEALKYIISRGVDVNVKTKRGWTPLMVFVAAKKPLEMISAIVKAGADLNVQQYNESRSALMFALDLHQEDVAKFLIDSGADLSLKDSDGDGVLQRGMSRDLKNYIQSRLFEETCEIVTETGSRCSGKTLYTKINGQTLNCKSYCKGHYKKIIEDFRKVYSEVTLDTGKYQVLSEAVHLNDVPLQKYNTGSMVKLFDKSKNIHVEIRVVIDTEGSVLTFGNKVEGWGPRAERWISSEWKISGSDVLSLEYDIAYSGDEFTRQSKDDIICRDIEYKTESKLGAGTYGEVSKIGENILVKKMEFLDEDGDPVETNIKELCFLAQYSGKMITSLKCIQPKGDTWLAQIKLSGQSLDGVLKDSYFRDKCQKNADFILYQILVLFSELEKHDITHGDLKPANIVVDENMRITVIDWGSVCLNSKNKKELNNGTQIFMPLLDEDQRAIGPISDVYSLGLTILFLYTHSYKFSESRTYDPQKLVSVTDKNMMRILNHMCQKDYKNRKLCSELIRDSFFDKFRLPNYPDVNNYKLKIREPAAVEPYFFENPRILQIVFKWLLELCMMFKTFYAFVHACQLFEMCMSRGNYEKKTYQLLAIVCLYLAIIMNSGGFLGIPASRFVKVCDGAYTFKRFTDEIKKVLITLNFIVYFKTFDSVLSSSVVLEFKDYSEIVEILANNVGLSDEQYIELFTSS
jgi:hypothetical protein